MNLRSIAKIPSALSVVGGRVHRWAAHAQWSVQQRVLVEIPLRVERRLDSFRRSPGRVAGVMTLTFAASYLTLHSQCRAPEPQSDYQNATASACDCSFSLRAGYPGPLAEALEQALPKLPPLVLQRFSKGWGGSPHLQFFELRSSDFDRSFGLSGHLYSGFYRFRGGIFLRERAYNFHSVVIHECVHAMSDYLVEDTPPLGQRTFEELVRGPLFAHKRACLEAARKQYLASPERAKLEEVDQIRLDADFDRVVEFIGNPTTNEAARERVVAATGDILIRKFLTENFVSLYGLLHDLEYYPPSSQTEYFATAGELFYVDRPLLQGIDPVLENAFAVLDADLRSPGYTLEALVTNFTAALTP